MQRMVAALALAVVWATPVGAAPAISLVGGTPAANGFNVTLGYSFRTGNDALLIDALGVFDAGNDGLAEPHDVAIFSEGGTKQLSFATVAGGTASPMDGGYRFSSVAPLSLAASTTYLIGAFYSNTNDDAPYRRGTTLTTAGLTFGENRISEGSTKLSAPVTIQHPDFAEGYFGPSFRIASVPEPTTWAMMVMGFAAVGLALRRGRPSAAIH